MDLPPLRAHSLLLFGALSAVSCGARSGLDLALDAVVESPSCLPAAPTCVRPSVACAAPTFAAAICDGSTRTWSCPSGSVIYARVTAPARCLPFHGAVGLSTVEPWGIGSFARIPTDDGRCLWIADNVVLANGTAARNVALEADPNAPFGSCPQESLIAPTPMVTIQGGNDPSILVQIDGGYRLGGSTRVLYRLFRVDSSAVYGVTEIGGGVAHLDPATGFVVIPSPAAPFPWGLDLDLGDAMLPFGDGSHELVWGCPPDGTLTEGCKLARLDGNDAVEILSKSGDWIASVRGSDGVTLFDSGRWVSAVVPVPGALEHLYVADYTRSILRQTSTTPEGPWSDEASLAACDLPPADPKAVCAAVVVHEDLADPTRPGEVPVTYAVGSTGAQTSNPDDYWPRLVWLP